MFYLVRIKPHGFCVGCNVADIGSFSLPGKVGYALGGLLLTQAVAVLALFVLRFGHLGARARYAVRVVAIMFVLLDVPVQVGQALLYNLNTQTWPTNVDLLDVLLLLQPLTGFSQGALKIILAALGAGYMAGMWRWLRSTDAVKKAGEA
ncbi:MAG: hypothetical protein Fur0018_08280 [Anaerolineales bacterium]